MGATAIKRCFYEHTRFYGFIKTEREMESMTRQLFKKNKYSLVINKLLAIAIFMIFLNLASSSSFGAEYKLIETRVTRVVDGDTVQAVVKGKNERIRMIGVDTPETKHPTKPVEFFGKEASEYTKSNLEGRTVWLELDVEERDRYGRVLAYIWLNKPTDRTEKEVRVKMFNAKLLLNGYAQLATFPPNVRYVESFRTYQTEARQGLRGLWAENQKGKIEKIIVTYIGNRNSMIFHQNTCSAVVEMNSQNKVRFESKQDALNKGFKACGQCKP